MPLVIGGPYKGGFFGGTSLSIGASGNLTDAVVSIDAIPNLTIEISETIDMSQYINDPGTLRTATSITGLAGFASYDSGTELLTGVSEGVETGLQLEVTY